MIGAGFGWRAIWLGGWVAGWVGAGIGQPTVVHEHIDEAAAAASELCLHRIVELTSRARAAQVLRNHAHLPHAKTP